MESRRSEKKNAKKIHPQSDDSEEADGAGDGGGAGVFTGGLRRG